LCYHAALRGTNATGKELEKSMWAVFVHVLFPVIPYINWKRHHKDRKTEKPEIVLRYLAYLSAISFMSAILLGLLSSTDTSFWIKINESPEFAVKFICMELFSTIATVIGERFFTNDALHRGEKLTHIFDRYVCHVLLWALAILVVCLNVSLMFDNVLWGDEAFTVNTAEKSVGGILQVMYFWDNHPPLSYYWLKLFGELFGFSVPICHLSSLVPFIMGILIAVLFFRKYFGNISAAIFVVVSGLGAACLQYNLEIRMYSLAFGCLLACFYCSYRVISTGKKRAWVGMVLWALAGAYSHYYALVAAGGILFMAGVCVWLKQRGKSWIKGLAAILLFLAGYAPWMYFLFTAIRNVSGNWWSSGTMRLRDGISIIMGSTGMERILFPLFLTIIFIVLIADSGFFRIQKKGKDYSVEFHAPSLKNWTDETYTIAVGLFTIVGTIAFGYLLSLLMQQSVLIQRYLYPLSAVALCLLVSGSSRILSLLGQIDKHVGDSRRNLFGKLTLSALIMILLVMGLQNYKAYSTQARHENEVTEKTLETIGTPDESVQMVTNGVKHLGWTVLYHYYPNNEIVNGNYNEASSSSFWYFNPTELNDEQIKELEGRGIAVTSFGQMQISVYPFYLYYMESDIY